MLHNLLWQQQRQNKRKGASFKPPVGGETTCLGHAEGVTGTDKQTKTARSVGTVRFDISSYINLTDKITPNSGHTQQNVFLLFKWSLRRHLAFLLTGRDLLLCSDQQHRFDFLSVLSARLLPPPPLMLSISSLTCEITSDCTVPLKLSITAHNFIRHLRTMCLCEQL